MKLSIALRVAKQMLDTKHPSTIQSKKVCPTLKMMLAKNGQFITSQECKGAKKIWSFEAFVAQFEDKENRNHEHN